MSKKEVEKTFRFKKTFIGLTILGGAVALEFFGLLEASTALDLVKGLGITLGGIGILAKLDKIVAIYQKVRK